ncbi:hypothetical protein [Allorhizocola rhizosphaerae]|uniref:hypothetical protein n=1 Tax=Allorhizocola rhizosphaerae TaxID=1872709 RepID=UPI000E3C0604|nr:hypothetical protein [Allorhizocola rhizosphaerae]
MHEVRDRGLDALDWQRRLATRASSRESWRHRTAQLIDEARVGKAEVWKLLSEFTFWIGFTARRPHVAQRDLLGDLLAEFARLVKSVESIDEEADRRQESSVLVALDQAIGLQEAAGTPVTDLLLAKAGYLRSSGTMAERLATMRAAVASAVPGDPAWARAMVTLCAYQVAISRYDDAIKTARELGGTTSDRKYRCAMLAHEGVAHFTAFHDHRLAQQRFVEVIQDYGSAAAGDSEIGHWVAMAYHYLARLMDLDRRHRTALDLYFKGKEIAESSRQDVISDAFVHLRVAETLVAARLFDTARTHLDVAQALVIRRSDRSSARVQVELGYAKLDAAMGRFAEATRRVKQARQRSGKVAFWRGELLCTGYLLALAIQQKAWWRLPWLAGLLLGSAFFGELRRNNLTRLILKAPLALRAVLRQMSSRPSARDPAGERITTCPCDLHGLTTGATAASMPPQ